MCCGGRVVGKEMARPTVVKRQPKAHARDGRTRDDDEECDGDGGGDRSVDGGVCTGGNGGCQDQFHESQSIVVTVLDRNRHLSCYRCRRMRGGRFQGFHLQSRHTPVCLQHACVTLPFSLPPPTTVHHQGAGDIECCWC